MMKVNIDAGNNFVLIAKDDIRMITSTPEGVWLYYKKSENGTLFTSSTLEPTELFKKIARAISCTPEQPTLFRKRYSSEGEVINNCFCNIQEPQTKPQPLSTAPKINRGNMNDKELATWLRSVAKDLESVSAQEESISTLMQDLQDNKERLVTTNLHLSEAIHQPYAAGNNHRETQNHLVGGE